MLPLAMSSKALAIIAPVVIISVLFLVWLLREETREEEAEGPEEAGRPPDSGAASRRAT